jgi:hypothetical protein
MGGIGSGQYMKTRGDENKTTLVRGTGIPDMPKGLSKEVQEKWRYVCDLTTGVTFSQDSAAILEAARLMVRQDSINEELDTNPETNIELARLSLAVSRQLMTVLGKLGLTPRDRQMIQVPVKAEAKKSRLQEIRERQSKGSK